MLRAAQKQLGAVARPDVPAPPEAVRDPGRASIGRTQTEGPGRLAHARRHLPDHP